MNYCIQTINRRQVMLLYLLLLLLLLNMLIQTISGQAGNFKIVDIFNAKKNQRRKLFFIQRCLSHQHGHFSTNTISGRAVGQCGPCPVPEVHRDGWQVGCGSVTLARCDYLPLGVCDWTTTVARYDTTPCYKKISQIGGSRCSHEGAWCWLCTIRQGAWCKNDDRRQVCIVVAAVCLLLLLLLILLLLMLKPMHSIGRVEGGRLFIMGKQ